MPLFSLSLKKENSKGIAQECFVAIRGEYIFSKNQNYIFFEISFSEYLNFDSCEVASSSSTRNTSKTFYAQYESSLSKSNTNRTEPLVLSNTVINIENGEFSRFIARFKKRKRNKRGEFTRERRESDASRQDPRHVASIGGGVPFVVRFHGEHRRQRAAASEPSQST